MIYRSQTKHSLRVKFIVPEEDDKAPNLLPLEFRVIYEFGQRLWVVMYCKQGR